METETPRFNLGLQARIGFAQPGQQFLHVPRLDLNGGLAAGMRTSASSRR